MKQQKSESQRNWKTSSVLNEYLWGHLLKEIGYERLLKMRALLELHICRGNGCGSASISSAGVVTRQGTRPRPATREAANGAPKYAGLHVVIRMPLNIRNEETEELASTLAKLTGETKTEAVTQALRERLQRVRRARTRRRFADELDEIALHCPALPVRDSRTADEIIGYDENGLPR